MTEVKFAAQQGRIITKEDKIFGINNRAQAMIEKEGKDKVINATIGALMDDNGELIVLSSVTDVFRQLKPAEFAEYAPICGTPPFIDAVKKDAFGSFVPHTFNEAVVTPGGTGAIRNTVANFSDRGDSILVADWHWAPYNTIALEIGRTAETFEMFNDERTFNIDSFSEKVKKLLKKQERLVIILNTPAHNPTGYALTNQDWQKVIDLLTEVAPGKKITLLVDMAYIAFAGDGDKYREFMPLLETLPENVLPVIAHSLSKGYTLYGMRCGAMICMAKTKELAEEFKMVCGISSRGSWSNCARAPQEILAKIYADPKLKAKVDSERKIFMDMLSRRGKAFEKAAAEVGLETVPFDAGFFVSIPSDKPDIICKGLEEKGVFAVPFTKGIRFSIASVSEDNCKKLPAIIMDVMNRM